ncbi:methyl-accepting chemotaxis protein [Luteimonas sp. RD2P54]|uniref:Methyl-accepting chemotaxis protein n=1 Tax=Luteimonas endophytica TaxID=3042023 RepID=A0ABT6JA66_9GAMM|nr:methyl-accepting chemotaxis protein [Luteimonas endophytica]MDH5823716.1 methyl-accepting chemotaxis protein [Luteimonas endophytica]
MRSAEPASSAADATIAAATLPDVDVPMLRIGENGRILATNRSAADLLGLDDAPAAGPLERVWGLQLADLQGEEGVWNAPGGDPASRVRYRRNGAAGWWLSLPDPDTAALLRDAARLAGGDAAVSISAAFAPMAARLEAAAAERALLEETAARLASCRLDYLPPAELAEHPLARRLAAGFGNLSEAIRQAVELSVQIAADMPEVRSENQALASQSDGQVAALARVREVAAGLIAGLEATNREVAALQGLARDADGRAAEGCEAAGTLSVAMRQVEERVACANGIIEVIDEVAFQTNILSINASIEAARAGEVGRGFAVVAKEIRALSERTASAARDVRGIIAETTEALAHGSRSAQATGEVIGGLGEMMARTGRAMAAVAGLVDGHAAEIRAVDGSLAEVAGLAHSNHQHALSVVERSGEVLARTDVLQDCVGLFELPADPLCEPRHARVRGLAHAAAARVGRVLEAAAAEGRIAMDALFSREYVPVPGTNPEKFHSAFDALCDELLPAVQERAAAAEPWIVFAICANPDGYVPTHNLRFSQPLTGDPARDLVGNRTKRIFTDRVGRSVGCHTDDYRLQVYRRDTGEIMFDLSVPVFVGGRHWGGFRVGYALG